MVANKRAVDLLQRLSQLRSGRGMTHKSQTQINSLKSVSVSLAGLAAKNSVKFFQSYEFRPQCQKQIGQF
jgi:hypothetical protein